MGSLVVFASGIVDEGSSLCGGRASVLLVRAWLVLVWNLVRLLVGVGLAHCWVLKDQAVAPAGLLVGVGCESSGPPFLGLRRGVWGWGWWVCCLRSA